MRVEEYSEALLAVHEAEIAHLEALLEERQPILAMVDKHRSLLADREQLAISSQDASRLMSRGGAGAPRDPTRLLREERMRKRIGKELPRIEGDLRAALEHWEEENGRPFTVKGEDYLEALVASTKPTRSSSRPPMAPLPKRPNTPGSHTNQTQTQTRQNRSQSVREGKSVSRPNLKHSASAASTGSNNKSTTTLRPKTPVAQGPKRPQTSHTNRPKTPTANAIKPGYGSAKTPSRTGRPPLTSQTHEPPSPRELTNGNSSSNNRDSGSSNGSQSYKNTGSIRRKLPPAPPPKRMATTPTPSPGMHRPGSVTDSRSRTSREGSLDSSVRCLSPNEPNTPRSFHNGSYLRHGASTYRSQDEEAPRGRQSPKLHPRAFSGTSSDSSITAVSSENWETYEESADEDEAVYYQKMRNAMGMGDRPGSPGYAYRYGPQGGINNTISIVGVDVWDEH